MKSLSLHELRPDMVAAEDIKTAHGQVIAAKGSKFSGGLITKLRFYGITLVPVEEDENDAIPPVTPKAPAPVAPPPAPAPAVSSGPVERDASTYSQRIKQSDSFVKFNDVYKKNISLLEVTFHNIKNREFDFLDIHSLVNECADLFQSKTTLDLLNIIHNLDIEDNIYTCNLNVALISRGIGRWLKFPKDALDILTLSGLLHDIGKILIPPEILNKPGKLTDEEFASIKKHPLNGQRLLRDVPGMDQHVINAAMQHHERYDGSGYPMGLMGDEIDPHAAIVAIADVYDAMTAVRAHREPLSPFQVIEAFENDGLSKYNPQYILTFLSRIASAYQNRMVTLNDGRTCRVIYINSGKLSHPIVEFEDGSTLDMSRKPDMHITAVI